MTQDKRKKPSKQEDVTILQEDALIQKMQQDKTLLIRVRDLDGLVGFYQGYPEADGDEEVAGCLLRDIICKLKHLPSPIMLHLVVHYMLVTLDDFQERSSS